MLNYQGVFQMYKSPNPDSIQGPLELNVKCCQFSISANIVLGGGEGGAVIQTSTYLANQYYVEWWTQQALPALL